MGSILRAVVVIGLIGAGVYLFTGPDPSATRPSAAQAQGAAPLPTVVSRPPGGVIANRTGRSPEAPFEIVTSAGADYFLKLVDAGTGQDALTIYVRGGERLEVTVPLGSYRMRYAAGETWRGETHLFGPGDLTSYSASESVFTFEVSGGYVNGYTVELIRQVGGNMDTRRISPSQF
jgi:hypothetical protein